MNPIWLIGLAVIGLAGCMPADKGVPQPATSNATPAAQPTAPSNATPAEPSVTRQVIEGFTGKTAVDAGQRTKAKIKAINEQRSRNYEEIPP